MNPNGTTSKALAALAVVFLGLLCYTVFLRMAVPILQGRLTKANEKHSIAEIAGVAPLGATA